MWANTAAVLKQRRKAANLYSFVLYCVGGSKVPVAVYASETAAYALSAN